MPSEPFHRNQVALVSQTNRVPLDQLMRVSAAVQKQVARDFRRYWNIDATVDAFANLKDVPLGYWQIIIRDDIPYNAAGIHLNNTNGQPYALVRYSSNWSLTVSHECLEMLADPSGNRVIAGDSVKTGQGRVEYLVEVCDPSEAAEFGYTVDSILVSDFYTPEFFDPLAAPGVLYSFSGKIKAPRQVLNGGYLSWRDPVSTHLWQLFVTNGKKKFVDRGPLPKGFENLRSVSDRLTAKFQMDAMEEAKPARGMLFAALGAEPAHGKEILVDAALSASADALQKQIDDLVGK